MFNIVVVFLKKGIKTKFELNYYILYSYH